MRCGLALDAESTTLDEDDQAIQSFPRTYPSSIEIAPMANVSKRWYLEISLDDVVWGNNTKYSQLEVWLLAQRGRASTSAFIIDLLTYYENTCESGNSILFPTGACDLRLALAASSCGARISRSFNTYSIPTRYKPRPRTKSNTKVQEKLSHQINKTPIPPSVSQEDLRNVRPADIFKVQARETGTAKGSRSTTLR